MPKRCIYVGEVNIVKKIVFIISKKDHRQLGAIYSFVFNPLRPENLQFFRHFLKRQKFKRLFSIIFFLSNFCFLLKNLLIV